MRSSFDVPRSLFEETKRLVRIHDLYFVYNPFETWTKYQFYIEGDVQDYNSFSQALTRLLRSKSICESNCEREV